MAGMPGLRRVDLVQNSGIQGPLAGVTSGLCQIIKVREAEHSVLHKGFVCTRSFSQSCTIKQKVPRLSVRKYFAKVPLSNPGAYAQIALPAKNHWHQREHHVQQLSLLFVQIGLLYT